VWVILVKLAQLLKSRGLLPEGEHLPLLGREIDFGRDFLEGHDLSLVVEIRELRKESRKLTNLYSLPSTLINKKTSPRAGTRVFKQSTPAVPPWFLLTQAPRYSRQG
jgi:hypothetical protein